MDVFSKAIGDIVSFQPPWIETRTLMIFQNNQKNITFEHLWEWTIRLESLPKPGYVPANLSDFIIPLLNIDKKGQLQSEIKNIIDELDLMSHISIQQKDVIKKFKSQVTQILDPDATWQNKLASAPTSYPDDDSLQKRHDDYSWFVNRADELLADVEDQVGKLEGLRKSAESILTSVGLRKALRWRKKTAKRRCGVEENETRTS